MESSCKDVWAESTNIVAYCRIWTFHCLPTGGKARALWRQFWAYIQNKTLTTCNKATKLKTNHVQLKQQANIKQFTNMNQTVQNNKVSECFYIRQGEKMNSTL
jgi:hypothetical protein